MSIVAEERANGQVEASRPWQGLPDHLYHDPTDMLRSLVPTKPLGEQLVEASLLSVADLEAVLELQWRKGKHVGDLLHEMGVVSEEDLLPFLARKLGVPGVQLREGLIDPCAARLVPENVAERLESLAIFRVRDTLTVAMAEPQNLQQIDELEQLTRLRVRPVFAFSTRIHRMIERCYRDDFSVDTVTADFDDSAVELQQDVPDLDITSVEQIVDGSPIINLVNYLILQSLQKKASDIHIEPNRKHSAVRFRIDGQLVEVLRPRLDIHPAIVSRIKVMGKMDIAEHRSPQDGRCRVSVEGHEVDLRISTLPTVLGEKVVIRVLDRRRLTFQLGELGLPNVLVGKVKGLLEKPYGLMLVTGPTGSGKTTTLYSALELIKSVHRNIVTVEDPVEYQMELINQVQVDPPRSLDFSTALRSILRQDPDVIMIGEIRDPETAQMAVQAALTGHLVLSTLHTNDSAGAVTRLVDMGVPSYKVAACLVGVVAQRLVRTICPNCRTSHYASSELLETMHYEGDKRRSFSRGEGCAECFDTGYQGRTGIYEVLVAEQSLREMIAKDANLDVIRQWLRDQGGGMTLARCGMQLAEKEITSLDEVWRVASFE